MKPSLAPPHRSRRVISVHLVLTLYGHWAVNDPRGSGSSDFIDLKFQPLGQIHQGRRPGPLQPTRRELKDFHIQHEELLNFPVFWIDSAKREAMAQAIGEVIRAQGYTCYACAICGNHVHLIIRTHKHDSLTIWNHFAEAVRNRLRLRFAPEIAPSHPVISARPYKVFLYETDQVWDRIDYVEQNPRKENLPAQRWEFVVEYDNFPFHRGMDSKSIAEAKAQAAARRTLRSNR
jgi:REP element-mobilizing transposase RayT